MTVVPIFNNLEQKFDYITLSEALSKKYAIIEEINRGGSVPILKVKNKSAHKILLLDGEEVSGAKQNRILNTSILLKGKSKTIIPVSCTEAGRWSYKSRHFSDSGIMYSPRMRQKKAENVLMSLKNSSSYDSNQSEVWSDIEDMAQLHKIQSSTKAMKDVYDAKEKDLSDYLKAFVIQENQNGILVFINGKVFAMDTISNPSAFKEIYPKLLKSYAMDAITNKVDFKKKVEQKLINKFKSKIEKSKIEKFKSIGHGWDYRFEAKRLIGSALVYKKCVIHGAFFKIPKKRNNQYY